jgi:hypothetical protein
VMTISELKALEELLEYLKGQDKVFLVGCNECATVVQVGGEPQIEEMAAKLKEQGKTVTGSVIGEPGCHMLGLRKQFREHREEIEAADALLVLSCGTGAQTAAQVADKPVHTATNTLFLGCVQRFGQFAELCSACGECTLERTGNICSVTRCAKGLQNGPCGGTTPEGKCEVDPETDCAWLLIYNKLKEQDRLDDLKGLVAPKEAPVRPGQRKLSRSGGSS